jgi:hypothetical protein
VQLLRNLAATLEPAITGGQEFGLDALGEPDGNW